MKTSVVFDGGICGIRTMADGSLRIQIDTQELPSETMMRIFDLRNMPGMVLVSSDKITQAEIKAVENSTSDFLPKNKTHSQRLRAVLFKLWKQEGEPKGFEFDTYYANTMERLIEHYKDKLQ